MFKTFLQLTISQRLKYLQYLIIAGLALIGGANFIAGQVSDYYRAEALRGHTINQEVSSLSAEIKTATALEKSFVIERDEAILEQHAQTMAGIDQRLALLEASVTLEQNIQLATALRAQVTAYQTIFNQAIAAYIDLGLTQNLGREGALRAAVHEVEAVLDQANQPALTISMLSMRRHEKDYFLRGDNTYFERLITESYNFKVLVENSNLSSSLRSSLLSLIDTYVKEFRAYVETRAEVEKLDKKLHESEASMENLLQKANAGAYQFSQEQQATSDNIELATKFTLYPLLTLIIFGSAFALYRATRVITESLGQLGLTVQQVAGGNYGARSNMTSTDELGDLGRALDNLLDDRVSTLAEIEKENEQLNNSVIDLMESVAELSSRDLTIRATVAEDVTGPVADAINMLANETARVLADIQSTALEVETVARSVQGQSEKVTEVAEQERELVASTLAKLKQGSEAMQKIAQYSIRAKEIAEQATSATEQALNTVGQTADGMNDIRSSISEAEKRIKRLGERSLEISTVVEIINNIAERTHVLALNASMQAAAAGDAGRGFAVVAEEVRRLAESSRRSTSEITELVTNIQSETSEAMATMNKTIEQVVVGTELAEQSTNQMMSAQNATQILSKSVTSIAEHSKKQSVFSNKLMVEATQIVDSTQKTGEELATQSTQSESLVAFSAKLLSSVQVFKLN